MSNASQTQSKAQRRAEAQRRAAEKRAAEVRQKRVRTGTRVGAVVAVIALAVVLIVVLTSGGNGSNGNVPPQDKNPNISLQPIPASMSSAWVQPPAGTTTGGEGIAIPNAPKLATLINAATGQPVDGIQCQTNEGTAVHVHSHVTIFVNGQAQQIPAGIGIPGYPNGESCLYWMHSHYPDGIIHVESPNRTDTYTLGQWFDEWGIPLSSTQLGPAKGHVTVLFTAPGHKTGIYTGNPRNVPIGDHYQIQLEVGSPIVAPVKVTNWANL